VIIYAIVVINLAVDLAVDQPITQGQIDVDGFRHLWWSSARVPVEAHGDDGLVL